MCDTCRSDQQPDRHPQDLLIAVLTCVAALALSSRATGQCGVPASIGGSGGISLGVDIEGSYAFSVEFDRLTAFDISDPADPFPVGTLLLSNNFLWDVKVSDGIAVGADAFWGVRIADVRNPAAPAYLSTYDTPYAPESVAVSDYIVYAADGQSSVRVIDISDPTAPFLRSSISIYHPPQGGWYAQEVVVEGSMLYVGSEAYGTVALDTVDVSNPSAPIKLGALVFSPGYPVGAADLALSESTAYLTDTSAGLHIIDVSDAKSPVEIGSLPGAAGVVHAYGSHLLLGRGSGLDVVDVSNPATPIVIGNLPLPGRPDDIAISGNVAMVAVYDAGLASLDLTDPDAPALLGGLRAPSEAADVVISSGLAYVADGPFGLRILDIGNPIVPTPVAEVDTPGWSTGLTLIEGIAYVADGDAGLQIIDVSNPLMPAILGGIDTPGNAVEVAVHADRAFVADGTQGLQIIDVSDPASPDWLGHYFFPGVNAEATSVFIANGLAYMTDRFYGLRIIDVTNPSAPFQRSATDTYSYANDVVVNGVIAYVADYSKRIYVMDVSNPNAPTILWSGPQNGSAMKIALQGTLLWLSQGQGGYLETYDVTDPSAPIQLPSVGAPTLGGGLAFHDGILVGAFGYNGLRTFQTNGLPCVVGPSDTSGCAGGNAMLSAAAAGQTATGAQHLNFQWRFEGMDLIDGPTGSGSVIAGAHEANLVISILSAADVGAYDCVVTNACGPTQSQLAVLTLDGSECCAGDVDSDGSVDLGDYELFAECINGPNGPNPGCDAAAFARADIDLDADVDLADFAAWTRTIAQPCP